MRRANGAILGILLATVAVPAFAADMPIKAAPPPPPPDWSGVYTGVAAGGAWGRQNLNAPVSPINNLFGTSADRILNGTPTLIQPDFDMGGNCVIGNCNRLRTSGFIGGGFAGVQKQWGNWVVGIEGSWDWTSMKKSLSATTSDVEDVIRFVPTTTVPVPTTVSATVTRSVDVSSKIDQIADIRGKFGFANGFMGPNWLFYFTSGAAVGHFERTLNLTQTVSVAGDGTRTNTFASSTGDTRLGWVVGAGFDWKMTPNVLLGVLYRHHEFPKSTISFIDDSGGSGRPVSFGTSRAHVDSVQGRLSWLFPIQ
jgi:outer membrane immunogenic protein